MSAAPPPEPPPAPKPEHSWRMTLARIGALAFVIIITLLIYALRDRAEELKAYGYTGIFVISVLSSATIVLPAPGLTIVFAAGSTFWPVGVGLAAGLGATIGELSGYLAGFSGQAVIEDQKMYDRLEGWMKRYGPLVIAGLGFLPLPFFDLAGIAAGALRMPVYQFLLWCAVGKIPKMMLVAYAGAYSIDWFAGFIK